jgi:hypothetical protein
MVGDSHPCPLSQDGAPHLPGFGRCGSRPLGRIASASASADAKNRSPWTSACRRHRAVLGRVPPKWHSGGTTHSNIPSAIKKRRLFSAAHKEAIREGSQGRRCKGLFRSAEQKKWTSRQSKKRVEVMVVRPLLLSSLVAPGTPKTSPLVQQTEDNRKLLIPLDLGSFAAPVFHKIPSLCQFP